MPPTPSASSGQSCGRGGSVGTSSSGKSRSTATFDFVCFEAKLIIEADGAQHLESVHDQVRDRHFEAAGYRTLRLWNADILTNIDGVATMIAGTLKISP